MVVTRERGTSADEKPRWWQLTKDDLLARVFFFILGAVLTTMSVAGMWVMLSPRWHQDNLLAAIGYWLFVVFLMIVGVLQMMRCFVSSRSLITSWAEKFGPGPSLDGNGIYLIFLLPALLITFFLRLVGVRGERRPEAPSPQPEDDEVPLSDPPPWRASGGDQGRGDPVRRDATLKAGAAYRQLPEFLARARDRRPGPRPVPSRGWLNDLFGEDDLFVRICCLVVGTPCVLTGCIAVQELLFTRQNTVSFVFLLLAATMFIAYGLLQLIGVVAPVGSRVARLAVRSGPVWLEWNNWAGIVLILLAIPIIVLLRAIGVRGQSLPDPAGRRDPD
ncbi:hypothetical protein [Bradyrhizobium sp. 2TAF24]|uniref:hypothetical protein n=1 Tax=Bradyrhizobium sp. 2TAF24 TaxID=3233011 RepID=UPI003F8F1AEF